MQKQDPKSRHSAGKNNRSLFRRTIFLMVCMGVVFFIPMVAQLWKLQISQHDYWQERAANQQLRDVAVDSGRGTIYDAQGERLAMSAQAGCSSTASNRTAGSRAQSRMGRIPVPVPRSTARARAGRRAKFCKRTASVPKRNRPGCWMMRYPATCRSSIRSPSRS